MKKIITTLLVIGAFSMSAQIEVKKEAKWVKLGEVKAAGHTVASVNWSAMDNQNQDTAYAVTIRDCTYKTIWEYKTCYFKGMSTANDFHRLLKQAFLDENKRNKDFTIAFDLSFGKSTYSIRIMNTRMLGSTYAILYIGDAYGYLSESQVSAMFGRE